MENPPFKFIGWLPINISYCVSEIIYNWWIFMGKSEMVLQKPPNKIKEIGAFCHVWFQTDSGHFSGEIWWDQAAVPGALLLREVPKWCTAEGGAILMGEMWFFLMGVEWDSTDFSQDGNPTSAWFYVYHAPPTNQLIGIWLWHIPSPTVGSTRYGVWTCCTQNPFWWFIAIFLLRLPVGSTYVFQTTPGFSKSCETRSHHPS